ncbi:hypothetical protein [Aeromicrobium terrae]|uniref:Phosphatase PAP2 family protein n=1 Tax=Aeromicrobium terrae TaxID=2498846 RepID=A0A5C8NPB5_9ACTN|nr:hypothetical protein [Aeromicrobium terrae]TXL62940.1 hypothetical protein FHP06_01495 [Aeromicrobium terrae]
MTSTPRRRPARRYLAAVVAAVIAVVVGVAVSATAGSSPANMSATDRVKAHPPPQLFSDAQVFTARGSVDAQAATASRLMRSWWKVHGTTVDDTAFLAWVETQLPAPPSAAVRRDEMREVKALDARRTPAGVAAASWLEAYGKKDVWKLYAHDQRELLSAKTGKADKAELKLILKMAKTAADALGTKDQQSAPYVIDPTLRPDHTVKPGQVCPCSYPSRHAARAAGARTFLGTLSPHRLADYRWMEGQIDFSRLYMAGHVQSDLDAGALLGDMIGQYVLVTRGHLAMPS